MTQQGTAFHYRVGWLARVFGRAAYSEIRLEGGQLHLVGRRSGTSAYAATDLIPRVVRDSGFLWDSVRLSDRGGRPIRIGGLRRADALALVDALERWFAPAKPEFYADLERSLAEAEALVRPLVDGVRFVRRREAARAAADAGVLAATLRDLLALSDAPRELEGRCVRLQQVLSRIESEVEQANERFVAAEMGRHSMLFDTVEAQPLTAAQRRACVVNDEHNLVLAGAGTGKTSVMIGRVAYLLAAGLAEPESILMVAYNRDAAQELRERAARRLKGVADVERLTIKTFHALGLDLIAAAEGVRPSVSVLAEDSHALSRFVTEQLNDLLRDPGYAAKFIEYGFDAQEPQGSIFDFASLEDYERELARLDLRTLKGERVKSQEELRLANFLTRNGIEYRYEQPFPVDTATREHRQYRPDFTIPREGAGPLFLEHFGINERGDPPPFFDHASAQRYREQIVWKRELYQQHKLPLVETYSYEFRQGVVFDRLREKLAAHGIERAPQSDAACLEILRASGVVAATAQFFAGLVPLARERRLSGDTVEQHIATMPWEERGRVRLLWELLQPIIERYESELTRRGEIDFPDMIRRATEYVASGRVPSPFTQLLVDEFQDISAPRAELILALARSRPGSSVFCVGDDWQSIYRFAGSDIRYISQFETRVGSGTTTRLDRTFRFNDQIGQVASEFVMRNPAQMKKRIESQSVVARPAVSLVPTAEPALGLDAVLRRIDAMAKRHGRRYSVYVLARYWYELEEFRDTPRDRYAGLYPGLEEVKFSTVHGAKGLEADFVVVVGLEAGRNGFPADKPLDLFQEMFLPPKEAYPFAEERRLFYVALTRARHRVYLLFDAVGHSPFVRELREGGYPIEEGKFFGDFVQAVLPIVPCPSCATGEMRPRVGQGGRFFGCSRFPACLYRERGCGSCGGLLLRVGNYCVCSDPRCDGVHLTCPKCSAPMEHRSGPYGAFFGCSKYGSRDLLEQCSAIEKWRRLPAAGELRGQLDRSSAGSTGLG
jgi:DNA helicase IV